MVNLRGIVFTAMFAALMYVFSFVHFSLGFTSVPIVLTNMAVMMAGALLGPLYGFLSVLLVVVLTALGLPMLGGEGGIGLIIGQTGGYIWMWPVNALLVGLFARYVRGNGFLSYVGMFLVVEVFGSLLTYVTGVSWLAHVAHLSMAKALVYGFYPFLPGDALKALVTAIIVVPVRQVFPVDRLVGHVNRRIVRVDDMQG